MNPRWTFQPSTIINFRRKVNQRFLGFLTGLNNEKDRSPLKNKTLDEEYRKRTY